MKSYYRIPITSPAVEVCGVSLYNVLHDVDYELFLREGVRRKITYEENVNGESIALYNKQTREIYRKKSIPEYLYVAFDGENYFELCTEKEISCFSKSYLDVYKISNKDVCLENDYLENVSSFFEKWDSKKVKLEK